jgi:hypothetical protein
MEVGMRVRVVVVMVGLAWACASTADAAVFCSTKKGAVKLRESCKPKETVVDLSSLGVEGPAGNPGDPGAPGSPGADGQLRVYGDGSAGAKTVAADELWTGGTAPTNFQFTDVTINAATTLTVPSGTVIRCTGTFTNNGTIVVQEGASGAFVSSSQFLGSSFGGVNIPGEAGIALRAAQSGEIGDTTSSLRGGIGGTGVPAEHARSILAPGVKAGGGGGASYVDSFLGGSNDGNPGGGSLVVLCQGAVVNNGTITADGASPTSFDPGGGPIFFGGGGGGGGVVILASKGSVTNGATGTVNARGGAGKASDDNEGASGGGGGGIIHLLAPAVTNSGATAVTGGLGGVAGAGGSVSGATRGAGGGGGASGGGGGSGGGISSTDDPANATNGSDGYLVTSTVDPTALF